MLPSTAYLQLEKHAVSKRLTAFSLLCIMIIASVSKLGYDCCFVGALQIKHFGGFIYIPLIPRKRPFDLESWYSVEV